MIIFFWAALLTTAFIFFENIFLVFTEGHGLHGKKTIKKVLHGKFDAFNPSDKALVSGVILSVGILIFSPAINTQFLQASVIEAQEIPQQALVTKFVAQTEARYENEVFGSTVNKFIVNKQFNWEEVERASPNTEIKEDSKSMQKRVAHISNTATQKTIQLLQKDHYNQFAGKYRAIFSIKGFETYSDEELINIKITDRNSGATLAQKTITQKQTSNKFIPFAMDYTIENTGSAPEITFSTLNTGAVSIEGFSIISMSKTTDQTFSVQDTFEDIPDPHASQGSARYADPEKNLPGTMLFGPYDTTLKAGQYMAEFRIKTDQIHITAPLVRIQTANLIPNTKKQHIETKEIRGIEFEAAGKYQAFLLPATVTEDGFFEIRAYFYDQAPIWIDSVRLYNTTPKS